MGNLDVCTVCGKEYDIEQYKTFGDLYCSRDCAVKDIREAFASCREEKNGSDS